MKNTLSSLTLLIVLLVCGRLVFADTVELTGAGATFPYPLYSKLFDTYFKKTGVKINYQSIGSGGGIKQIQNKTVDFGATDGFLNDEQLKKMVAPILHIPTCLGAVAISYNIPGIPEIRFTPELLADIFLGKIKKWSDGGIKKANPTLNLPEAEIILVHRSDGSGTSFILTDYLSKISKAWSDKIGKNTSVNWPVGLGGKGNEGVAGLIKQIPNSLGYVELIYALQNNMSVALIKNKKGNFIKPTPEAVSLAANITLPADTRVSITDTQADNGYPISGFTWLLIYQEQNYAERSFKKTEELVKLFWWILHEGQQLVRPLSFSPLPIEAVKNGEKLIKAITFKGKPILN